MAEAREVHAALVELQRRLERQVAFFEFLDDRLELGDRRLEVLDGGIHESVSVFGLIRSSVYLRTAPSTDLASTGPSHLVVAVGPLQCFLSLTSQVNSPCSSVTWTREPFSTRDASRMIAVRSAFQQTA